MAEIVDFLRAILNDYGFIIAFLVAVVIWLAWLNDRLHRARYKERQKEIDRLAADNRDYRDQFMRILDNKTEKGNGK